MHSLSLCLESDTYKNFFRSRHDFTLSLQTLELVQTKSNMSSHSVKFSSTGVLNLSNKDKANYFVWKINKKMLKLTKLMAQILSEQVSKNANIKETVCCYIASYAYGFSMENTYIGS